GSGHRMYDGVEIIEKRPVVESCVVALGGLERELAAESEVGRQHNACPQIHEGAVEGRSVAKRAVAEGVDAQAVRPGVCAGGADVDIETGLRVTKRRK